MPRLLFKYRSLSTATEVERVLDIIFNNRLYLPTKSQLNDPMEGAATPISTAYTGCGMYIVNDLEDRFLKVARERYRLVSLSENCFSPQLWAYYAGSYNGICLCYRTDKNFCQAKKVKYISTRPEMCFEQQYSEELLRSDFLLKQQGWKHEQEWRIIIETGNEYFNYDSDELVGIILGHRICETIEEMIRKCVPANFPLLRVHPGLSSFQIRLIDADYKLQFDGSEPPFISDTNTLCTYVGL